MAESNMEETSDPPHCHHCMATTTTNSWTRSQAYGGNKVCHNCYDYAFRKQRQRPLYLERKLQLVQQVLNTHPEVVHLRYQVPTQVVYISDDSGDECNGEDSSDLDPDFETPRKMHNAGGYGVTSHTAHEFKQTYRQPARGCSNCKATYSHKNQWYFSPSHGKKKTICRNCKNYAERHPGSQRPIYLQQILNKRLGRDTVSASHSYRSRISRNRVRVRVEKRRKILEVVNITDSSDDDSGGHMSNLQLNVPENDYDQARYGNGCSTIVPKEQNIDDQVNLSTRRSAQGVAQIPDDGPQAMRALENRASKSAPSITGKSTVPAGHTTQALEAQGGCIALLGLLNEAEAMNRLVNAQATQACIDKILNHVRKLVVNYGDHASLGLLERAVEARVHSQEGKTENIRAIVRECYEIIESRLISG